MFQMEFIPVVFQKKKFVFFLLLLIYFQVQAQLPFYNFRHLTTSDGLSDGTVHSFAQDKYGFIWIGTSYGLNRYDGLRMKQYFSMKGDSNTINDSYVKSLYCDRNGDLWAGTLKTLSLFNYSTGHFTNYSSPYNVVITDILEDQDGNIWMATNDGLWTADKKRMTIRKFLPNDTTTKDKLRGYYYQMIHGPDSNLYIASSQGIKIINPKTGIFSEIRHSPLPGFFITNDAVNSLSFDLHGNLWAACGTNQTILNKIDLKTRTIKKYNHFIKAQKKWSDNSIRSVLTDSKGRLWISSIYGGLSLYDEKNDNFHDYKIDPVISTSLLADNNIKLYQDNTGIIWMGTAGYGLDYFNPDKNLFYTLHPVPDKKTTVRKTWSRAACEDKEGNLWLGTGQGLVKYNRTTGSFTPFANTDEKKNVLFSNSIRSLVADDLGDIWIGTAKGLNRYQTSTGKIDFFDERHGIPRSFFWMMAKDHNGQVWVGSVNGLYLYRRSENRFDNLRNDPVLAKYAPYNIQAMFVDSRNRLWFALYNAGAYVYDINARKISHITSKESLLCDDRVSAFAEAKDGTIWIGTEDGLTAYDPKKNQSVFLTKEDGLPSNRTNNPMVDDENRLWIGTSNGLCVITPDRHIARRFDVNDGLPTNQFNEQCSFRTSDGYFVYPTYQGFVLFNPSDYQPTSQIPFYLTSFHISEQRQQVNVNPEELQEVKLRHDENFFQLELTALNFMNPAQCKYAYKLEPFDKNWIYTAKKEITYTNVPPGTYHFRFKATTDNNWDMPEKVVKISISEVFYKSWWFVSLVILLLSTALFLFYRYRLNKQKEIFSLQGKAQLLEKEKALVMYENLKQHLNPHFLFNSLTSLRNLIRTDKQKAADFLDHMSRIYRYILKSRDSELMSLKDELNFVQAFIDLQKARFEDGLQVNISVNEELSHMKIVPVTLQNLIENAIKHNLVDQESPLVIDIINEDGYLVVKNNLQKKEFVETSNKHGLENLRSLYRYLERRPVVIIEDDHSFSVKIPLI